MLQKDKPMADNIKLKEATDQYFKSLKAQGKSKLTIEVYKREINRLISFTGNILSSKISTDLLNSFVISDKMIISAEGKPRGETTLNRAKACLKSFGYFLEDENILNNNPARQIKTKRTSRNEPDFLNPLEKKKILKAIKNQKGDAAERDYIIIELFLNTGIRLFELVNLNINDIKMANKKFIIRSKGGFIETRFINTKLRNILKNWLRKRRDNTNDCQALFLSNRGTRITGRQIERRFTHWLEWAGIDNTNRKLSVHSARHTFATTLYGRTKNLILVSKALGHRQISTTKIYTHLFDHELEDAIEDMI